MITDDEIALACEQLTANSLKAIHEAQRTKTRYSDAGIALFSEALAEAWDEVPEDVKQLMREREAAMTPEDWVAFSEAVVQEGPAQAELLLNAIPEEYTT